MKIGIMGAMIEEISLLKDDLIHTKQEEIGDRDYYSGKLYGIDTTLVFSRWGKVASATTATTLITKYNIDCLLFTGIAGAISSELNIGDVVIGNQLYQHDMDARPLFDKHEIPLTGKIFFNADQSLILKMENAVHTFLAKKINEHVDASILHNFSIDNPRAYTGMLASGDIFVGEHAKTNAIKKEMPDVLAVEMEGAAVAQVCSEHNIPFIVVRTISDKADHNAAIDFQKFISDVARHYSKGIIQNLYAGFL